VLEATLQRWFTQEAFAAGLPEIERARAMILSTSVEGYAGCAAAISKLDYLPRLGQITTPALFVVGSEDPGTPPAAARMMHQAVKGSHLVEIEGAAHLSNLERPAAFNAAISEFLFSLKPPQV
jgi:3-oxoadipate enol-lactonase